MNLLIVNLEKALIKQNRQIVTAKELLQINEFEKQSALAENDTLNRIGINKSIKRGGDIKVQVNKQLDQTKQFDQTRVFHISQIKKTCMKYYLRFLPTYLYNGSIDDQLPLKINTFELAHGVRCESRKASYDWNPTENSNTFIMAPKESFDLQQRPKDPLMFYKINEEYYYLIHKWGNDLSITRQLKSVFSGRASYFLTFVVIAIVLGIVIHPLFLLTAVFGSLASGLLIAMFYMAYNQEVWFEFIPENEWNSPFKD